MPRLILDIPDANFARVCRAYGRLLRMGNDDKGNPIVAAPEDLLGYITTKIEETVGWSEQQDEVERAVAAVDPKPALGMIPGSD